MSWALPLRFSVSNSFAIKAGYLRDDSMKYPENTQKFPEFLRQFR